MYLRGGEYFDNILEYFGYTGILEVKEDTVGTYGSVIFRILVRVSTLQFLQYEKKIYLYVFFSKNTREVGLEPSK